MRNSVGLDCRTDGARTASDEDFAEWRHAHRVAVEAARVQFDQQMVARWHETQAPPGNGDPAVHALAVRAADLYALCFSPRR